MKLKYRAPLKRRTMPRPRKKRSTPRPSSRAARMLALAYHIDHLVEVREIKDYAEAARRLGVTRARMTQIVNLLFLPLKIQEEILTGELTTSERALRTRRAGENGETL